MSKNQTDIPFTELVERAIQIARIDSVNDASRARAAVNDHYCRVVPAREDWSFLLVSSAITCVGQYVTGTVSINTQDVTATFSSDVVIDTAMIGRKIKFNSNANVYTITARTSNTVAIINPPLSGTTNVTNDAYTIFQDVYALASDFDRFPKNGGLIVEQGGRRTIIKEQRIQEFLGDFIPSPGLPSSCEIIESGTASLRSVVLTPPPTDPIVMPYWYLLQLKPLRETTAGFVDVNSGATAVTGSAGTTRFTEVNTGAFLRISAFGTGEDSEWYRVNAIGHNSSATLGVAFGLSGATTAGYVISDVPRMPSKMHLGILYGAVKAIVADQNDPLFQYYDRLERELMVEARKQYKTRVYDQEIDTVATEYLYRR